MQGRLLHVSQAMGMKFGEEKNSFTDTTHNLIRITQT